MGKSGLYLGLPASCFETGISVRYPGLLGTGHIQGLLVLRGRAQESLDGRNSPICPGYGPGGRWVGRLGPGSVRTLSLGRMPGLSAGRPVPVALPWSGSCTAGGFPIVVGVKSNVIARAAISPGSHHDHPYFRPLVIETAKRFDVETVVADLGYSSRLNYKLGGELGLQVRIPFKENTRPPPNDGSEWSKDLRYFQQTYDQFMSEYHPRSNVECTNPSVKRGTS